MKISRKSSAASNLKEGTAIRNRGRQMVSSIVKEAQAILITEGYAKLTTRRVAANLGISIGNFTYYFKNKESLLRAVFEHMLNRYEQEYHDRIDQFPNAPQSRLRAYTRYLIEDCQQSESRASLFQLWSIATHHADIAELRDELYERFFAMTVEMIRAAKPELTPAEVRRRSFSFLAFIEGVHVVMGLDMQLLSQSTGLDKEFTAQAFGIAVG